jgi:hypothetical protein
LLRISSEKSRCEARRATTSEMPGHRSDTYASCSCAAFEFDAWPSPASACVVAFPGRTQGEITRLARSGRVISILRLSLGLRFSTPSESLSREGISRAARA